MKKFKDFNPEEIDAHFKEAQLSMFRAHEMKWVKPQRQSQMFREAKEVTLNGDYRLKRMSLYFEENDEKQWTLIVDDGVVTKQFKYKDLTEMVSMMKYIPSNMPSALHHAQSNRKMRVPKIRL